MNKTETTGLKTKTDKKAKNQINTLTKENTVINY